MTAVMYIVIDRNGVRKAYPSIGKAAEALGVSQQAVSQALKEKRQCRGATVRAAWRFFVVRDGKRMCLCTREGGRYVRCWDGMAVVGKIDSVKEVTEAIWNQEERR